MGTPGLGVRDLGDLEKIRAWGEVQRMEKGIYPFIFFGIVP